MDDISSLLKDTLEKEIKLTQNQNNKNLTLSRNENKKISKESECLILNTKKESISNETKIEMMLEKLELGNNSDYLKNKNLNISNNLTF